MSMRSASKFQNNIVGKTKTTVTLNMCC